MSFSVNIIKLLDKLEPSTREVLIAVLEELERQREATVTKTEFNELRETVRDLVRVTKELAEAQKRTEERLEHFEKQTEENFKRVWESINELAEVQKRSESRLGRLEQTVAELAEAQKRSESRLDRLEQTVAELAEAQKRSEEELCKLISEHRKTREQLGGLSHTVGYILEDRAYVGLPPLLERDFGLKLLTPIKRDFLEISPGRYQEINIIAKASCNGKEVYVLGECKTQLKKRDVDKFLKNLAKIKETLGTEVVPILVAYQASPPVRNYAEQKGVKVYFSYQFPL